MSKNLTESNGLHGDYLTLRLDQIMFFHKIRSHFMN